MKKQAQKIDWELFDSSSCTEEAMYFWLFGKYEIDGFEKECEYLWTDEQEYKKVFKTMRKIGIEAARKDCEKWLKKTYGNDHVKEVKSDYCTCDSCPIHGDD